MSIFSNIKIGDKFFYLVESKTEEGEVNIQSDFVCAIRASTTVSEVLGFQCNWISTGKTFSTERDAGDARASLEAYRKQYLVDSIHK